MNLTYYNLFALLLILFCLSFIRSQVFSQVSVPDFPFEILDEPTVDSSSSKINVFIPPEYYNKDNIEKLFKWHSARHERTDLLIILVYTSRDNYLANKDSEEVEANRILRLIKPDIPKIAKTITVRRNAAFYDAFFRRTIDYTDGVEEINERYTYCPSLENPHVTETIVIKGRDPFNSR